MIAAHDDDGTLPIERLAELGGPTDEPLGMKSEEPINCGPQQHYVLMAALAHLEEFLVAASCMEFYAATRGDIRTRPTELDDPRALDDTRRDDA